MNLTDIATAAAVVIGMIVMIAMALTPTLVSLAEPADTAEAAEGTRTHADVVDLASRRPAVSRRAA